MSAPEPESVSVAQARNNLTDVAAQARYQRRPVVLTSHGKPQTVLFPLEMLAAVQAAGGYEKALEMLAAVQAAGGYEKALEMLKPPPSPPQAGLSSGQEGL